LLQVDPTDAFGNLMLGSLQFARKQYELAESSLLASIAAQPTAAALNDLAWILKEKGDLDAALQRVDEALAMDPANGNALDTKGMVLFAMERYPEAEQYILRALGSLPRHYEIAFHLAQVYRSQGRVEEALEILEGLLADVSRLPPDLMDQASELRRELRAAGDRRPGDA
jgi:tetratricopeptide (TPR) repeat protein